MRTSTSLLLIIISLAVGFFYTYPNYKKIAVIKQDLKVLEDNLAQSKEVKDMKNSLIAKYKKIDTASLDLLKKVVPESFDSIRFIGSLNEIAVSNNMSLSGVSVEDGQSSSVSSQARTNVVAPSSVGGPGGGMVSGDESVPSQNTTTAPKGPYVTKSLSFSLSGSYKDFIETIKDFENSIQIIDIKSLDISNSTSGNNSSKNTNTAGGLTFSVKIATYSIK